MHDEQKEKTTNDAAGRTIPYDDIKPVESGLGVEDCIGALGALDADAAGRMKYAFEAARKKAFDRGVFEGYEDGYRDGYKARGEDDL